MYSDGLDWMALPERDWAIEKQNSCPAKNGRYNSKELNLPRQLCKHRRCLKPTVTVQSADPDEAQVPEFRHPGSQANRHAPRVLFLAIEARLICRTTPQNSSTACS